MKENRNLRLHKKKCLAVHGDLTDFFWNAIHPNGNLNGYGHYDYVFSGHSHLPQFFLSSIIPLII